MPRTFTFTEVKGLRKTLRMLPKAAQAELRDASVAIADDVSAEAAGRARSLVGVAGLVASSLKARRDRVPKIVMGGSKRLPADGRSRSGSRQTVGDVIWGAEFGSDRFRQFRPWRGNKGNAGYFLWPTVRDQSDEIIDRYGEALMDAVDKAARRYDG